MSIMISQLPTCNEMDPLDQSLDELDDPSSNFLQDFLTRQNGTEKISKTSSVNGTPLSGYTSEESDFSTANPEEAIYEDMSFVPADIQDETELAQFSTSTSTTSDHSHNFGGKVIKGKTSKYRGVTQTSKTSWGAKYSAKRITNTCKTPEEAARAYDVFLKENHPQKYAKFANFCIICDQFVNPLGLPEYQNECICENASTIQHHSPAYTDADTETDGDSPICDVDEGKLDSFQFQLTEEHAPMFEDATFNPMVDTDDSDDLTITEKKLLDTTDTMGDVNPVQESYSVDQFLRDSESQLSIIETVNVGADIGSIGNYKALDGPNTDAALEDLIKMEDTEPTVASSDLETNGRSSFMEFSAQELNDLRECLADLPSIEIAENNASGNPFDHANNLPTMGSYPAVNSAAVPSNQLLRHSLDLDLPAMEPFVQPAPPVAAAQMNTVNPVAAPAISSSIIFQTPFLEKYWRNDRKNIQCFPFCPEHGDYYRVRIENLQHRCKGVCRAAVKARLSIQTDFPLDVTRLIIMARCNSTFSRSFAFTSKQTLTADEMKTIQMISANGSLENIKHSTVANGSAIESEVTFYPDVWKFEFDLPKKRRHNGSDVGGLGDDGSEFSYFFEVDIFYTTDNTNFIRLGHNESVNFQIGNTRTLLRQRNKMNDDSSKNSCAAPSSNVSSPMDMFTTPPLASMDYLEDSQVDMNKLPEKKKIKMKLGQLGRASQSMRLSGEMEDQVDEALIPKGYNKSKPLTDEDSVAVFELASGTEDEHALTPPHKRIGSRNQEYSAIQTPKRTIQVNPEEETRRSYQVRTQSKVQPDVDLESGEYHASSNHASENSQVGLPGVVFYSLFCIPLCVFYAPVAVLLLVPFLLLPPFAGSIAKTMDVLGDFELRLANHHTTSNDSRLVLNRLEMDTKSSMAYHRQSATWNRFVYLMVGKLIVSALVFVISLPLAILGVVFYPIRPVSSGFLQGSMGVALFGRDYTRKTFGTRLQGGPEHSGSICLV